MAPELPRPALLLAAALLGWPLGAAALERASFPASAPEDPLELKLAAPKTAVWGRTPPLRLIYYAAGNASLNELDRRTILRELKLIRDFYAHYGLAIQYEDRVYEVQGTTPKDLPAEQYDYYYIKKELSRRKLLVPRRTIVFTTFDVGLGADMALTGLNNRNTAKLECPRPDRGDAWWCGRPEAAHWGGSVHEVGHMLGLAHPYEYTADAPYSFSTGGSFVFEKRDARRSVMMRHDLFFINPDNGLLPHDVDLLYGKYRDAGARPPVRAASPF